ncbi:MAG: cob(I)yrinic acid a,c-diamide adenosyltransferase [Deltaproteobacteria bacterium]|nr:cob(I)yrinic acid a,c-diamide adenosyltransferase [Deltaproteobacteria bacterium]
MLVHTGDGKGKSTSAFGLALRAVKPRMRVHIIQFIKGSRDYGELETLGRLGGHRGARWRRLHLGGRSDERQRELAAWGIGRAHAAIEQGVDVLVLDEVNIVLGKDFLPVDGFLAFLNSRPPDLHVVCTGRYAPDALIEAADLVTRHELIKHPFQRGVRAQPGVEF